MTKDDLYDNFSLILMVFPIKIKKDGPSKKRNRLCFICKFLKLNFPGYTPFARIPCKYN